MSTNVAPFEIIAQPYIAWVAPVGTAFPNIEDEPTAPWTMVGTSGDLNYDESGVMVKHSQKTDVWRPLGSTGARKAFRTEEELKISLKLCDVSLEQYQNALNGNTVSTVAPGVGTAGYRKLGLSRGRNVAVFSLLIRGTASPYGDEWNSQYEIPVCFQSGEPDPSHTKGKPAELALEYTALEDSDATDDSEKFGRLIAQDTEPGT